MNLLEKLQPDRPKNTPKRTKQDNSNDGAVAFFNGFFRRAARLTPAQRTVVGQNFENIFGLSRKDS